MSVAISEAFRAYDVHFRETLPAKNVSHSSACRLAAFTKNCPSGLPNERAFLQPADDGS